MFCVWWFPEFSDAKYKGPVGLNTKGLITYANSKKGCLLPLPDCFLRPDEPTHLDHLETLFPAAGRGR